MESSTVDNLAESSVGGNILFIDDDASYREISAFNLRAAGYRVDIATDGSDGLDLFGRGYYDLVITDVNMPGISGLAVVASIHRRTPDIPIIVITAYADVDTAVTAMRSGAIDFLEKPSSRKKFITAVKKALGTLQP